MNEEIKKYKKNMLMTPQTLKKLLETSSVLTFEEVLEIVDEHKRLFGEEQPFNPIDSLSAKFFADRVRWFYQGNKSIMKTHLDFKRGTKKPKLRSLKKMLNGKVTELTVEEKNYVSEEYKKLNPYTTKTMRGVEIYTMIEELSELKGTRI